ncbi:MAG TPA: inositol monophosphatase family protein [Rhodopila sp.]|uniref:inositol monophosphatase family protein n=1 Tax=Rhodopila sp. TaxID=2480087 RepID=UPI002C934C71|nr:inositol monophosphatase family protein [Rhodopila sp.]HVY18030.1 inositol monophosphatase family protein [Rhodopila sp.]
MTAATLPSDRLPAGILPEVIDLVRQAGVPLAAEFALPTGPRALGRETAPIDTEIELFLRERLTKLLPARFVGEEAGVLAAEANGYCWVVDPHDGTRACLEGRRGSAISVGLLFRGQPVLGVVYAPLSPDRGPDLIAWAEGAPMTRNGLPVQANLGEKTLTNRDVVFLNHGAWQRPVWNSTRCAPARFMPLPSIAYRLARVAVGDGIATVTLRPVNAHDIAAGHALLTAAGGVLVQEDGEPVRYDVDGASRPFACFGGAPAAVAALRARTWRGATEPRREDRVTLAWPRVAEGTRLDRALGCLLGLAIGDSLGSQVEFMTQDSIRSTYPAGVREIRDSPVWRTQAGQPTDDTELALALARSLVRRRGYNPQDALAAYRRWFQSGPFDIGTTIGAAFGPDAAPQADSQGNGSLMRVAPIGVWAPDPETAAHTASLDSELSHPHPVCRAACAAFAAAIAAALDGTDRPGMRDAALLYATETVVADAVQTASPPEDFKRHEGWVLIALRNAFHHLNAGTPFEAALIATASAGGDTDTNAAIAGALLGAADGRASMPVRWIMPVLTCRPDAALHPDRPRPEAYWPDDLLDLAEALLLCGGHHD